MKTKIVATCGPSSRNSESISQMISAGIDVFRMNFSHGSLDDHQDMLEILQTARRESSRHFAIMGDLCGPKIRTSHIEPDGRTVRPGQTIYIINEDKPGTAEYFGTNYPDFLTDIKPGHRIFIDDGSIELKVITVDQEKAQCSVIHGGPIKSRKGINLPDTDLNTPSITRQDWQCVDWAIEKKLDYLALSFVRSVDDIERLKEYITKSNSGIRVVSKIETPYAVSDLENIIIASDAVLVARGDLGVEMPLEEVPLLQKRITHLCRKNSKPVIVATQMLQSMISHPTATRAEVSDVANAILDYTDAVMLSGETAVGKYPIQAINTLNRIACVTEAYMDRAEYVQPAKIEFEGISESQSAIARCVGTIVEDIEARIIAVLSDTGKTAQMISKARVDTPIVAFSSQASACRQMCMMYGVIPVCREKPESFNDFTALVDKVMLENGWAQSGDHVVLIAGSPFKSPIATDAILVHKI